MGHRHKPFYRISVADSRSAATGKFLEQIGHYDPNQNPPVVKVNEASALKWLKQGARPSDTVRSLFHREGIMEKSQLVIKGKITETTPAKARAALKNRPKVHKKVKEAEATAAKESLAAAVKATAAAATAAAAAATAAAAEAPAEETPAA